MKKKDQFIVNWSYPINRKDFESQLKGVITEAIAEHEQSKWKRYPENKPEEGTRWLIETALHHFASCNYNNGKWWLFETILNIANVIAFRELPEPYREDTP